MLTHKVYQDVFTPGQGNCMSACLATILGLKLEDVPNFRILGGGDGYKFLEEIQKWLKGFNLFLLIIRLSESEIIHYPIPDGSVCIAGGVSPRHPGVNHAVVGTITDGYNFQLLFDPHPEGNGFTELNDISTLQFLIPLNPVQERAFINCEPFRLQVDSTTV